MTIAAALAAVAGCKAQPCSTPDEFNPISTVECPSGELCYQGACVPACNAGAERTERCESDSECTNSARPMCLDNFCTACDEAPLSRLSRAKPTTRCRPSTDHPTSQ